MTKKQYNLKIEQLEGKIQEMKNQIAHYKRQVKLLDAEDGRKILERYHISPAELEELIKNAKKQNREKTQIPDKNPLEMFN